MSSYLHNVLFFILFFSIIILITQTYKTKKYHNQQVLFYISSTWEKAKKEKLKQSEIEVKMIIKMKKHNLCSNWQIVFMSDTDKQTLIDLYEIFVIN